MVTMRSSVRDERGQHVERGGLARAGAPGDDDVQPALHAGGQEVGGPLRVGAERDEVGGGVRVGGELADGQQGPVHGQRRDDGVHAAAVGEAGVHHRAGLVDATADAGHDLVDGAPQVRLVGEVAVDLDQPAAALDVDAVRAVDHDLGEVRVAQERLDRAVAEDVVGDLLGDPGPLGGGEQDVLGLHGLLQRALDHVLELGLGQLGVVQLRAELLEQGVVHLRLEVAEVGLGLGLLLAAALVHGRPWRRARERSGWRGPVRRRRAGRRAELMRRTCCFVGGRNASAAGRR